MGWSYYPRFLHSKAGVLRCVIVLLCSLLVIGIAWNHKWLYQEIWLKRMYYETGETAGLFYAYRWSDERSEIQTAWFIESGFIAMERQAGRSTDYYSDGRVEVQFSSAHDPEFRDEPPWLFGVVDQVAPSAPWVVAGKGFVEWWDSIPEHRKAE